MLMLSFLPRWYYIVVVPADQSTSSPTARWRTPDEMELDQVGVFIRCCDGSGSQVAQHTLPSMATVWMQRHRCGLYVKDWGLWDMRCLLSLSCLVTACRKEAGVKQRRSHLPECAVLGDYT